MHGVSLALEPRHDTTLKIIVARYIGDYSYVWLLAIWYWITSVVLVSRVLRVRCGGA